MEETAFHIPQADDLEKVFGVATVVKEGATTAADVADRLHVVARQGFYYTSAAEVLGLIVRDEDGNIQLTPVGEDYLCAGEYRHTARRHLVLHAPIMNWLARPRRGQSNTARIELLSDVENVAAGFEELGLAPETALRRAGTIKSWMKAIA